MVYFNLFPIQGQYFRNEYTYLALSSDGDLQFLKHYNSCKKLHFFNASSHLIALGLSRRLGTVPESHKGLLPTLVQTKGTVYFITFEQGRWKQE